jgi:hypothetical protein
VGKRKIITFIGLFASLGSLSLLAAWGAGVRGEGESASSSSYLDDAETTATLSAGDYRLDFASSNLSFTLTEISTGETLHSGRRMSADGLNSATWKGLLSDGLAVGYRNDGRTTLKPYSTLNGLASVSQEGATLKITLNLRKISILLEMDLTLSEDGSLSLAIPFSSIVESSKDETDDAKRFELAYLLPYLALGDSFGLQDKGSFLFLPDGTGAIADLSETTVANSEYDHRIYGRDIGIEGNNGVLRIASSSPEKEIKMPVYGLSYAHEAGVEGIVEGGAPYADIYASLKGLSTSYNFACARFNYREEYYRYVDRAGNGTNAFMSSPYSYDAKMRYHFLPSGSSLGEMAGIYRNYLSAQGQVSSIYQKGADLRLEWLVSETKNTMFGASEQTMSRASDVSGALDELASLGIAKPKLAFLGYQKGGWSQSDYSRFRYASGLGEGDYRSLAEKASSLAFDFDYSLIRASSKGYGEGDLAMSISNQGIYTYDPLTYASSSSTKEKVMLTKNKTLAKFQTDANALKGFATSFVIKDLTSHLYSSHYGYVASRAEAAEDQASLLASSSLGLELGMPNDYLLKKASSIVETDLESSSYYLAPYSVPFYTMALSGLYDFYSKPLNLAYQSDMILRLIENGVYPSFLLTGGDSIDLYETSSSYLFSSRYSSWKEKISEVTSEVSEALSPFQGIQKTDYRRLAEGVSESLYASGKALYVNHTSKDYTINGITVPKAGYLVV